MDGSTHGRGTGTAHLPIEEIALTTEVVPPSDQFDFWREIETATFRTLRPENIMPVLEGERLRAGFSSSIHARRIGPLEVAEVVSCAQRLARHREISSGEGTDDLVLAFNLFGPTELSARGADVPLRPGNGVVLDGVSPLGLCMRSDFRHLVMLVPRSALPDVDRANGRSGRVLDGGGGLGLLLRLQLQRLMTLPVDALAACSHRMVDDMRLLVGAVVGGSEGAQRAREAIHRAQREIVERYVRERAALRDVAVGEVAGRFHVAAHHVERLFAEAGTSFSDFVTACRLDSCRAALNDPRFLGTSAPEVASAFGFDDYAAFCRLYQARYGVDPGWGRFDPELLR